MKKGKEKGEGLPYPQGSKNLLLKSMTFVFMFVVYLELFVNVVLSIVFL